MRNPSALVAARLIGLLLNAPIVSAQQHGAGNKPAEAVSTTTPIKHLIVIFDENISFDHYFGIYPNAINPPGEPSFHALPNTPTVNGLTQTLMEANPDVVAPFRLDRSENVT
jgi:phospholipase C